jgi:hypothetical protein
MPSKILTGKAVTFVNTVKYEMPEIKIGEIICTILKHCSFFEQLMFHFVFSVKQRRGLLKRSDILKGDLIGLPQMAVEPA